MSKAIVKRVPIDQALEFTKFGRFNYFFILVTGFIQINVVVGCLAISFVLPITKCDMELTYQQKGFLAAAGFLGIICSSHLWGFIADTMGRRTVIWPTLIGSFLASVALSFSPNFSTFLLLQFANGFFLSGGSATVFAHLGEFHHNGVRNRALMASSFISCFMALLLPIVAWAVINQTWSFAIPLLGIYYKPWRLFLCVIGSLGLICGLCVAYLPESPKYLLSMGRKEEALAVLKRMYSVNTGNDKETFEVDDLLPEELAESASTVKSAGKSSGMAKVLLQSMWKQTAPLFMREHRRNIALACFIQFWLFFTAHGLYMWFPFVLNKVMRFTSDNPTSRLDMCEIIYKMEKVDNALIFNFTAAVPVDECKQTLELSTYQHTLSFEAIYAVLFLGVGYLTGKIGRVVTLFVIHIICGVSGILSVIVNFPIAAVYLLQILLVSGLGNAVLSIITVDIFPTHLRAMAVCISLMMGRVGSVTGTNVIGALLERHCKTGLLSGSIALVINGFLALLLPRHMGSKNSISQTAEA